MNEIELNCARAGGRSGASQAEIVYDRPLAKKYKEIIDDVERSGSVKVDSMPEFKRQRKNGCQLDKRRQTIIHQTQSIIDSLRNE